MKRVMVITADYDPFATSNTNCIKPLLDGLERNGYMVDIITRRLDKKCQTVEEYGSRIIYRIDDWRVINTKTLNARNTINMSRFKKILFYFYSIISKALIYMRFCLFAREKRTAGWNKKVVKQKCMQLIHLLNDKYCAVISIALPFSSHEIAYYIKKNLGESIKWIIYDYDPVCYNYSQFGKKAFILFFKKQNACYKKCDAIFMGPELKSFYEETPFYCYFDKVFTLPFANMQEYSIKYDANWTTPFSEGSINLIYAGAIAEDIRNPQIAIDTIISINDNKFQFYLITGSDTSYLNLPKKDSNIHLLNEMPREEALRWLDSANVLINIGNNISHQVPGKLFEYMAMGKPIIHFAKKEKDNCLNYLKNYPYRLIIFENEDLFLNSKKITEFCLKYQKVKISYYNLVKYVPEYLEANVVSSFIDIINKIIP